jgi:hypothetical protein
MTTINPMSQVMLRSLCYQQRTSTCFMIGFSGPVPASGHPPSRALLGPIERIRPGVPEDGKLRQEVELVR